LSTTQATEPGAKARDERRGTPAGSEELRQRLVDHFAARAGDLPGADHGWLDERRRQAMTRFSELGFPTTRDEAWRYTSLAPITGAGLGPVNGAPSSTSSVIPAIGPFVSADITRIVFIDGEFRPEHSQIGAMPEGAWVTSFRRMLEREPSLLEHHFARHLNHDDHALRALNTAFAVDGAYIRIPEGSYKKLPIHIMYISTARDEPVIMHPRNLIVAKPGSRVSIVEHYVGVDDACYHNNVVTEMVVGDGATVEHYKLQHESRAAFHTATLHVDQGRDSTVSSHSIAAGARLARHEIESLLGAEGASASYYGLYMGDGDQHVDHVTLIDHAVPHCESTQVFKGIMNDRSRGVFTGRVLVREDAQQTNAQQQNRTLLLSDDALVESRPQLEIYADDVKCSHGSATGRLDEDSIFYLRSRGIGEEDARSLLTYAFASEILRSIRVKLFRTNLESLFTRWLPAGRMIGETELGRDTAADTADAADAARSER
jgi:Fe-S cluster assembly protein SufD